jgi:hypothetical protein
MNIRPEFMTPIPRFLKSASKALVQSQVQAQEERVIPSILCKRKYGQEFGSESFEDERYNQRINEQFFQSNIGYGVVAPVPAPASIGKVLDSVIADFRQDLWSFLAVEKK